MKIDPFANGLLDAETLGRMTQLSEVAFEPFTKQVEVSGLNPAHDFQYSDLSGVDFSHSDLAGFNFSGANLRSATGILVKWDATTIFPESELEESIFALPLRNQKFFRHSSKAQDWLTRVSRLDTTQKIVWSADQLMPGAPHNDVALPIAQEIFWKSEEPFLRSQLMFFLAPRLGNAQMKELLVASISQHPHSGAVVKNALSTAARRRMMMDPEIRAITCALLRSKDMIVRERALTALSRHRPSASELSAIHHAINEFPHLGSTYVWETARALGEQYKVVVRHPLSREVLRPGQEIDPIDMYLIARRWLKLEANARDERKGIPLSDRQPATEQFSEPKIRQRMKDVVELYARLNSWGIEFRYDSDLPEKHIPNLPTEPRRGE